MGRMRAQITQQWVALPRKDAEDEDVRPQGDVVVGVVRVREALQHADYEDPHELHENVAEVHHDYVQTGRDVMK